MSEMTLITKRYSDIMDFISKVNKSVIVFKKKSLLTDRINKDRYPKLEVTTEDMKTAKEDLLQSLSDLENLAASNESSSLEYNNKLKGLSESSALQDIILNNETERREIRNMVERLRANRPLSKEHFIILDKIIGILDNERSLLFRKLRTARG